MNIIAVDDEKLALEGVMTAINKAKPDAKVQGFRHGMDAVKHVENNSCDVAFLDIEMREINGIELAKKIRELNPGAVFIFITGHEEFAFEAAQIHLSGFLAKPVNQYDLQDTLRRSIKQVNGHRLTNMNHNIAKFNNGKILWNRRLPWRGQCTADS